MSSKDKVLTDSSGLFHCDDGPAVEWTDGQKEWWVHGKLHRLDGPAIEFADGSKEWYVDGKRHRLDGPAVIYPSGDKTWWVRGKLHRLDGPAIERSEWCLMQYFIDGREYQTQEQFCRAVIMFLLDCSHAAADELKQLIKESV